MLITVEHILNLHKEVISRYGGAHGLRDKNLLDSCVNATFQSFDDIEMFPTIQEKAAKLGFGIAKNHAFIDGNKRTAVHVMCSYLIANGIYLKYNDQEIIDLFIGIASNKVTYKDLLNWICSHVA